MEEPLREHHNVALVQRFEVNGVGEGRDEAGADGPLDHHDDLRPAGVGVDGDDAAGGQVQPGDGYPQAVDAGELAVEGRRHGGADDVGGVPGGCKPAVGEVLLGH